MTGFGEHMNHLALHLQPAGYHDQPRLDHHRPVAFKNFFKYHEVGKTGFIFNSHETDSRSGSGTLPNQYQSGHFHRISVFHLFQFCRGRDAQLFQLWPHEAHRVSLE